MERWKWTGLTGNNNHYSILRCTASTASTAIADGPLLSDQVTLHPKEGSGGLVLVAPQFPISSPTGWTAAGRQGGNWAGRLRMTAAGLSRLAPAGSRAGGRCR